VGFVFVDITSSDIEGYVRAAAQRINERVKFPAGITSSGLVNSSISKPPKRG
jgi:hypothetical protein